MKTPLLTRTSSAAATSQPKSSKHDKHKTTTLRGEENGVKNSPEKFREKEKLEAEISHSSRTTEPKVVDFARGGKSKKSQKEKTAFPPPLLPAAGDGVDDAHPSSFSDQSESHGHLHYNMNTTTIPSSVTPNRSRMLWVDEEDEEMKVEGGDGGRRGPPVALQQTQGKAKARWTVPDHASSSTTAAAASCSSSPRPGEKSEDKKRSWKGTKKPHHPREQEEDQGGDPLVEEEEDFFFSASKRFRHEDIDHLLSSTTLLLTEQQGGGGNNNNGGAGGAGARTPKVVSVLPLPRDTARAVHWHPSGQVQIVSGNHHVYIFHSAGSYVEALSKIPVTRSVIHHHHPTSVGDASAAMRASREAMRTRLQMEKAVAAATLRGSSSNSRSKHYSSSFSGGGGASMFSSSSSFLSAAGKIASIQSSAITPSGEDLIITGREAYTPVQLHFGTEQLVPLRFLDTRDVAVHRLSRTEVPKSERYITKIISTYNNNHSSSASSGGAFSGSLSSVIAVASGCSVRLGSLSSGSVLGTLTTNDPVTDLQFLTSEHLLYIASGKRVLVYDTRVLGQQRFLYEHVDEGALSISSISVSPQYLTVGSTTGVVSLYSRPHGGGTSNPLGSPLKTFSQLTTCIAGVVLGGGPSRSAFRPPPRGGADGGMLAGVGEQMLCYFTAGQKAGFRVAHVSPEAPHGVVVPSFPGVSRRHDCTHSVAFAPSLPILSVGERQRVVNYRM